MQRPRVLISNDDGIAAPGLLALAAELNRADFCAFTVSGPSGERSAQSHCITLSKALHAFEINVDGAEEAWAVEGTPADSVMIAVFGPLLKNRNFDLVVSGINRGDNCGLHVIYSGTVGAAREAACKDIPALAFSLDSYQARSQDQYAAAARYCVSLIKAALGVLPGSIPSPLPSLAGHVVNVNIPGPTATNGVDPGSPRGLHGIRGYYLTRQGRHCSYPQFVELDVDPEALKEGELGHLHMGAVTLRAFKNSAGYLKTDSGDGTDSWAVQNGWVAVTPLGLQSDVPITEGEALAKARPAFLEAVASIMTAAAADVGGKVGGITAPKS